MSKASVRELIHDKLNQWNRNLNHDLNSVRLNHSSNLFEDTKKLLSKKSIVDTAEITTTKVKFLDLLNSYLTQTDYRIDIKSFNDESYKQLKELCSNFEYTEYEANKKSEIKLDNNDIKLGLWKEFINYPFLSYKMVINTGYNYRPYIVINITLEN